MTIDDDELKKNFDESDSDRIEVVSRQLPGWTQNNQGGQR
jgi:hypothetical protein